MGTSINHCSYTLVWVRSDFWGSSFGEVRKYGGACIVSFCSFFFFFSFVQHCISFCWDLYRSLGVMSVVFRIPGLLRGLCRSFSFVSFILEFFMRFRPSIPFDSVCSYTILPSRFPGEVWKRMERRASCLWRLRKFFDPNFIPLITFAVSNFMTPDFSFYLDSFVWKRCYFLFCFFAGVVLHVECLYIWGANIHTLRMRFRVHSRAHAIYLSMQLSLVFGASRISCTWYLLSSIIYHSVMHYW